jgi:hypothetical protein
MGPGGSWFDFNCQPKIPREEYDRGEGHELLHKITPGPEIEWDSGNKIEFNIHPLCGINRKIKDKTTSSVRMGGETRDSIEL